MYNKKAAAAARERMAKRARRAQFWKKNKKRVLIIILIAIAVPIIGLLTPWGPDWYYAKIQREKMQTPGRLRPGTLQKLFTLGVFYGYSMKSDKALEMFDEIGLAFFGVPLSKYGMDPNRGYDERMNNIERKAKGLSVGPPYDVDRSDIKYVGNAIYRIGQILDTRGGRQFTYILNKEFYMGILDEEYPDELDPDTTRLINDQMLRFEGRK
jgi:hypothetical protein